MSGDQTIYGGRSVAEMTPEELLKLIADTTLGHDHDGINSRAVGGTPGPHAIEGHTDVTFTGLATGHIIQRDGGGDWVNVTVASLTGIQLALNDLTDAVITTPETNAVFQFDSANWIDRPELILGTDIGGNALLRVGGTTVSRNTASWSTAVAASVDSLFVGDDETPASGAFGASIGWGSVNRGIPGQRRAGIVSHQLTTDIDAIGISIFTHPSNTAADPLELIAEFGYVGGVSGIRLPAAGGLAVTNAVVVGTDPTGPEIIRIGGAFRATALSTITERLRIEHDGDASPTSTAHGFQVGLTSDANVIIDNNEIMARNNDVIASLAIQREGGDLFIGAVTGGTIVMRPDPGGTKNVRVGGSMYVDADFEIGNLGNFDAGSTPNVDEVLRFTGVEWVPILFNTTFTDGDVAASSLLDGTSAAFVNTNPTLAGAPQVPTNAPVLTPIYKGMIIDMSDITLDADEIYVLDYDDGGGFNADPILSTGDKVVHTGLTLGTTYTYRYLIRGVSDSAVSPTAAAQPSALTNVSVSDIILASQLSVIDLSSISANIGTITAGTIDVNVIINAQQLLADRIGIGPDSSPLATATLSMVHDRADSVDAYMFAINGEFALGAASLEGGVIRITTEVDVNAQTGGELTYLILGHPSFVNIKGTGALATYRAIHIFDPVTLTATVTTVVGLDIEDIAEGVTNNLAIRTGLGLVELGDDVDIAGTLTIGAVRQINVEDPGSVVNGVIESAGFHDSIFISTNLRYDGSGAPNEAGNQEYIEAGGGSNVAGSLLFMKGNGTETGVYLEYLTAPTSTGVGNNPATLTRRFQVTSTYLESTGQIRGPSGSAGAPSVSFLTETDGGMYRIAANRVGFASGGVLALELASTQAIHGPIQPRCRVGLTGVQAISTGTLDQIIWNSTDFDIGGLHDGNDEDIVIPTNGQGVYLFIANVQWGSGLTAGDTVRLQIREGTTIIAEAAFSVGNTLSDLCQTLSVIENAGATDEFDVQVFQNSGGDIDIETPSRFMAVKLW